MVYEQERNAKARDIDKKERDKSGLSLIIKTGFFQWNRPPLSNVKAQNSA